MHTQGYKINIIIITIIIVIIIIIIIIFLQDNPISVINTVTNRGPVIKVHKENYTMS